MRNLVQHVRTLRQSDRENKHRWTDSRESKRVESRQAVAEMNEMCVLLLRNMTHSDMVLFSVAVFND